MESGSTRFGVVTQEMVHELFAVLGLRSGASKTDVRQAYLRLAKQWHPDSNKDPGAAAKFKAISEAYEKLKDVDKVVELGRRADGEFASGGGAWQQQQRGGGWDAEARARRAAEREARRASLRTLSVLELMMHPRMLLLVGAAALGYYAVFAPQQRPTIHRGNETVNAWWNDKKSRWETPAPWDTAFQKLAPPLQQVPKHQVFRNAPPPT